ncbi:MAG: hypothetical protein QOI73_3668 [Solirubrobacteraceae bacterium]|nr:hypothetical protein [Solirubrobacteraceae bacterium]
MRQLLEAGVDRDRIKRWVADGRLRREHHGVYTLGHPAATAHGIYLSAAFAAGGGAVVSHLAAAYLMKAVRGTMPPPEVTIDSESGRRRPGIVIHRSRLHRLDVSELDGVPITILPRVLLDLAPRSVPADLARMCHEAWVHHGTSARHVEACIERNPGKPGAGRLRRAVGSDVTLSDLESCFLELVRDHGLALPRTNVDVRGDKVDCHWPSLGITVELLSFRFHATRHAFEADVARRRRSNHHAFTWGDVFERPAQTASELAALLAAPRIGGART